jgi:hypothetical protein
MPTDDPPPDDAIPFLKRSGIRRKVIEEDFVLAGHGLILFIHFPSITM